MRAGSTSIIINNQNLADANITGNEGAITKGKDITFKSRIGQGVSSTDLSLAVNFRNAFKTNNASAALNKFFGTTLESSFNNWNVGFDDILWWVVKKNFSYKELSQYGDSGSYLGNSILGNIYGSASNSITSLWSKANTSTSGLLNAGLGALGIGGNNYNEAGLTSFWDSASDSVGVMANSKYLQLDSTLPIFDVTQNSYGVPIPFSASTENKISQDTRNVMYDLSLKNTALMRRNLLSVAYGNLQIRGNMAADATVPHAVNLINDLPTLTKINQALIALNGALQAAIPNFKLYGFVKFISNIGNMSGFNLRDNRPITSSDRDFTVITNEARAQASANQINEVAAQAELDAAIQKAAQAIPKGGRIMDPHTGWNPDATAEDLILLNDESPEEGAGEEGTGEEGAEVELPLPEGPGATELIDDSTYDPTDPGPDRIPNTGDEPLPALVPLSPTPAGKTVVLTIGSNDYDPKNGQSLYNLEHWRTYQNTRDAISSLKAQGYNVVVVLPSEAYKNGNNGVYEQVRLAATSSGYKGVSFVEIPASYYGSDPTHPTINGYQYVVNNAGGKITAVVGDSIGVGVARQAGIQTAAIGRTWDTEAYYNGQLTAKQGANSNAIAYTYVDNFTDETNTNAAAAVTAGEQVINATGGGSTSQPSPAQGTTTVTASLASGSSSGTTSTGRTYSTTFGSTAYGNADIDATTASEIRRGVLKWSDQFQGSTGNMLIPGVSIASNTLPKNTWVVLRDQNGNLITNKYNPTGTYRVDDTGGSTVYSNVDFYAGSDRELYNYFAGVAGGKNSGNITATTTTGDAIVLTQSPNTGTTGTTTGTSNGAGTVTGSAASTAGEDGTAIADSSITGDTTEEPVQTPLEQALSQAAGVLGGTGLTQNNYSNQQVAAFVSYSIKVGNTFQEVDYLLKRIVRTSLRACKTISQRLAANPTGNYNTQLDNASTSLDLNSSLSNAFGIPLDSPLLSVGSSLISGIFTGQNATANLLNTGQRALGDLTGSLQSGVFGGIQQQVDGGISMLNGAGQLLGAGNLLPSTGELINALDPMQFLSTQNMPSILPNLNLGSLGDLLGIAASIGQNGPPTSLTGLIQLQEQIYTAICNFEIPIVEDLVQWITEWEAFFDGFEWKDIEKKIVDIVTKYIEQILDRFNIVKIIRDIIEGLDEQIENFLQEIWDRFTDCSRYQTEDRSGREGAQSTSWLDKQPASTTQRDVAQAAADQWMRDNT